MRARPGDPEDAAGEGALLAPEADAEVDAEIAFFVAPGVDAVGAGKGVGAGDEGEVGDGAHAADADLLGVGVDSHEGVTKFDDEVAVDGLPGVGASVDGDDAGLAVFEDGDFDCGFRRFAYMDIGCGIRGVGWGKANNAALLGARRCRRRGHALTRVVRRRRAPPARPASVYSSARMRRVLKVCVARRRAQYVFRL